MPVANDNIVALAGPYPHAYGVAEVVVIEAPTNTRSPYWRNVRLPGATVAYGFPTLREAANGEAARTLPISGAAAL